MLSPLLSAAGPAYLHAREMSLAGTTLRIGMEAAQWTAIGIVAAGLFATIFHLGGRIDGLAASLGARIDGLSVSLGARIDGLSARIDALTERVARLESRFDVLDARSTNIVAATDTPADRQARGSYEAAGAPACSTSRSRPVSMWIPGPIVVESVSVLMYLPFADAGFARISSSTTAR